MTLDEAKANMAEELSKMSRTMSNDDITTILIGAKSIGHSSIPPFGLVFNEAKLDEYETEVAAARYRAPQANLKRVRSDFEQGGAGLVTVGDQPDIGATVTGNVSI